MNSFSELIKNRRSMRKFTDEELTQEQVVELMKAALMAPTSKRSNAWQFVLVDDKETLKKLSLCKEQASQFIADAALAVVVTADPLASDVWIEDANLDKLGLQPEMEINGGVGVKVLEGVNVSLGYEYIKRCNQVYEPVNNLYMGATYDLFKNLQIYGKVNNLLNKDYVRADAYPAQGLNFLAGATFQF